MPNIVREELWTPVELPVVYAVTTNAMVTAKGLVMGRGAALQARNKIPGIAQEAGWALKGDRSYYWRIVRPPTEEKAGFGVFQVKYHWGETANLKLIEKSVRHLAEWCSLNPAVTVRMNYPGIGNGKRTTEEVEPLLEPLPNTVWICLR